MILKPAILVHMVKGDFTDCSLHDYCLVSFLFKQVNPMYIYLFVLLFLYIISSGVVEDCTKFEMIGGESLNH